MNENLRYRLEEHAFALLVAFSGVCFAIGLALQNTGKAINDAVTLGGPR